MLRHILYAHGGSANHGCEAIVRSLIKLLSLTQNDVLCSNEPLEDVRYKLDNLITVISSRDKLKDDFIYRLKAKLSANPDRTYYFSIYRSLSFLSQENDVALSIGGDNYCYPGMAVEMSVLLSLIRKSKCPSILLGCSIEQEIFKKYLRTDFEKYQKIVARESLTYCLLKESGTKNIYCLPDPAFQLNRKDLSLPVGFAKDNTTGINVSPLIIGCEQDKGIVLQNYIELIKYIIDFTDMQIALIPHVIWTHNDDRLPLQFLFDKFKDSGRICMIEDHNAEELKGYIARCRFMVAARTHASIAAYSEGVPTLVVGYSVKARGIAIDIFGTDEGYVIPVQSLKEKNDLKEGFMFLMKKEEVIRKHLNSFMPEYKGRIEKLKDIIL